MHLCTLGGFWWGMSGILAIVSVISRLGRGVCGSRTCCRPEIPLLRRSCVCRRWRVWERRQLERLAQQSTSGYCRALQSTGSLGIRSNSAHAPGTRTSQCGAPASGIMGDSRGRFSALPKSSMRYRDPTAQTSRTWNQAGPMLVGCSSATAGSTHPFPGVVTRRVSPEGTCIGSRKCPCRPDLRELDINIQKPCHSPSDPCQKTSWLAGVIFM